MSKKYFVCAPFKSVFTTEQCKINRKKSKDENPFIRSYYVDCIDCQLFKKAQKYTLEQIVENEHQMEFESCLSKTEKKNVIPRRQTSTESLY